MSNSKKSYKFERFLRKARKIVAERRAQYHGVYYMKGGFLGEALDNPITEGISDIGATLLGQPELIPLINAGETAVGGALQGESIGKALGQGGIAGAESLGAQELAGAVGIGSGNDVFNSALGITGDNPAGTGLPNIGAMFSSAAGGTPTTGTPTDTSSTATNPSAQPSGVPQTAATAGNLGGGSPGGASAPGGVTPDSGDVTNQFAQGLGGQPSLNTGTPISSINNTGDLSTVGTNASSSNPPGTPGVGGSNYIGSSSVGGNNLADLGSNAPPNLTGGSTGSTLGDIGNTLTGGSNTPSADTVAANNQTFSNLQAENPSLNSAGAAANGAPPPAAGGATPPPNSIATAWNDPTGGNILKAIGGNLGPLAAAGGIGLDALRGNQKTAAQNDLTQEANAAQAQGQQLENYLQTGTLPAGEQAGVNQALDSAIASIKSHYASMGMSGSSAEQQDIANAQQQAQAASAQMQEQLLSTGISETGMSSQLYSELLKNSMANDTNLSNAIANFASAASGGGQNINLNSLLQKTGAGGNA